MNALLILLGYYALAMIVGAIFMTVTLLGGGPTDSAWRDPILHAGLYLTVAGALYAGYRFTISLPNDGWGAFSWMVLPAAIGVGWMIVATLLQEVFKLW